MPMARKLFFVEVDGKVLAVRPSLPLAKKFILDNNIKQYKLYEKKCSTKGSR